MGPEVHAGRSLMNFMNSWNEEAGLDDTPPPPTPELIAQLTHDFEEEEQRKNLLIHAEAGLSSRARPSLTAVVACPLQPLKLEFFSH